MVYFFTNAPSNYDFHYVKTDTEYPLKKPNLFPWRRVEVQDADVADFEACQIRRYQSGLFSTIKPSDSDEVKRFWIDRYALPEAALQPMKVRS